MPLHPPTARGRQSRVAHDPLLWTHAITTNVKTGKILQLNPKTLFIKMK